MRERPGEPRPAVRVGALALCLPLAQAGRELDWPRWRGPDCDDASRASGVFTRPFGLHVRWRRTLGSGYSGVSVRGTTAVTLGASAGSDFVFALDADDGTERWRHRIGPPFPGQDGAMDGPVSTPTLSADTVFALGARGELLALDLASGATRWSKDLVAEFGAPQPHWGFTAAPLLAGPADELVIVAAGAGEGRAFLAFASADGALRWSAGTDRIAYQAPLATTIAGESLVLASGNAYLFGLDPADGTVRFRLPHGGGDFYEQVFQPLALGDDCFLLKNQRLSSQRVRIEMGAEGAALERQWSTRHLRQNYNMALFHDGLLFGHGGGFLSCVDGETGELLWRSREPGDGWEILVDGHLVVLTKDGGLHVARASPDGYEERVALALFEHLTWTPPSFARGRIYGRDSFGEVACVDVVPATRESVARAAPAPPPWLAALAGRVAGGADPGAAVEEFLADQTSLPLVEGERTVHFLFRGPAEDVVLRSDATADGVDVPLERLAGTDLYHVTLELEPEARIGYQFVRDTDRDMEEVLPDPRNPRTTRSFTSAGTVSELLMPRAAEPEAALPESGASGTDESFVLEVPVSTTFGRPWGGPRRVWVHLPHGYADSGARYPVLVVNDGADAREVLGLPSLLDGLAGRAMEPVIAVFVELQSAYELARTEQELYRDLLAETVLPYVDAHYRTRARADARAVLGWNEGAYAALFAALTRPEVFGAAAAQSLYHGSSQGQGVLERLATEARALPRVYLDWGRYDARDPRTGFDTAAFSRALAALLEARGAHVRATEAADGDQCDFWRARLPALLAALFPPGG